MPDELQALLVNADHGLVAAKRFGIQRQQVVHALGFRDASIQARHGVRPVNLARVVLALGVNPINDVAIFIAQVQLGLAHDYISAYLWR